MFLFLILQLDSLDEEKKERMLSQLSELKARKQQLDQLLGVLNAIRAEEGQGPAKEEKELPKLELASPPPLPPPASTSVQDSSYNPGELVADKEYVPGMEHLQAKLR